ncbi:uncharacterized protein [Halyomorpha halys]|uniref:uncharacterized protein n=1 Tax=Halyomorpha halys TaxID=286706 RepID=UPI0034D28006
MSRITAAEMRFLRRILGKTRRDRIRNERIREELQIPSVKSVIEHRQLRWYGHVCRMEEDRVPRKFLEARPTGRPRDRPKRSYMEHIQRLGLERGKTLAQMKMLARDRDVWTKWLEAPPH